MKREFPIAVEYDGIVVGTYRADLLIDDKLIVEVKAERCLTGTHERQIRNYLKGTKIEVGLLLGFGEKPEHRRFVHTASFKKNVTSPRLVRTSPR